LNEFGLQTDSPVEIGFPPKKDILILDVSKIENSTFDSQEFTTALSLGSCVGS
jgi:hypothetical protein